MKTKMRPNLNVISFYHLVETGEGLPPSYRTIYSLVKERRAFVVDYVM